MPSDLNDIKFVIYSKTLMQPRKTKIRLIVFDFDGVFTDGTVLFDSKGCPNKGYNVKDGMAIKKLKHHNLKCGIISGFPSNKSTKAFCKHLKINYVSLGNSNKLNTLEKWASRLKIDMSQIAYIGDDLPDIKCMNSVGISGCPADAMPECLKIAKYICSKKGGRGAVREFVDYIIDTSHKLKSISALVCAKLESNRCPHKNIRKFANSTLIDHKLQRLLELSFLEKVVFNTESQKLIDYVKSQKYAINQPKLVFVKRNPIYSTDSIENYDFCKYVTSNFPSECVLYSPVTMPFITSNTYNSMYNNLIDEPGKYDSIILAADGKQGGGHSNETHKLCFGASIMSVKDVQAYGDFIGTKPYFQECNLQERLDIDFPDEFNTSLYHAFNKDAVYGSEHLKEMSLYEMDEIIKFDQNNHTVYKHNEHHEHHEHEINQGIPEIEIIDVTTRDGGFTNQWSFTIENVEEMLVCASNTGIDYFEIGYLMNQEICKEHDGIWRNADFKIIDSIVKKIQPKCKISAMIDYWRYDIDKLLPQCETSIDLIRVTCYMHKIQEAADYCKIIKSKGYDVSLNVMCGSYFTEDVIANIIQKFTENSDILDYAYVADTYGAMNPYQVRNIYEKIIPPLRKHNIKIGFHIHNNGQVAMANAFQAIECGIDIIDASYSGMGRGAGNLLLEHLVLYIATHDNYAQRKFPNKLNIKPFLEYVYNKHKTDAKYIEDIKYTLIGFFNAHPYRLRDFDPNINLYDLYIALEEMPIEKKFDYLLG